MCRVRNNHMLRNGGIGEGHSLAGLGVFEEGRALGVHRARATLLPRSRSRPVPIAARWLAGLGDDCNALLFLHACMRTSSGMSIGHTLCEDVGQPSSKGQAGSPAAAGRALR